ncbi:ssDNA binding protein [Condylorrhiza vestigialis mutiple nucleopolyhedrovirus]|uniref:SsDNA binding protein n=1 Tax=Condylorrhiza vestigialis mutiple nucleopolyhedrovirus TaxID=1592576 RepID=A0A0B4UM70_9ABAC|nr:ssDNA binding protein [Condylorrhiza vestigialis mutiple nucleopolyhedrovirus]AJD09268.1 ssDNA binding protein [Condylorrhiza vestigialis mutiple nucleopolyhedrovirus]
MATKRAHANNDHEENVELAIQQETQLLPYNNSGFTMEVKKNGKLRVFTPNNNMELQQQQMSWQNLVLFNLQELNFTVINSYHGDLQFLQHKFKQLQLMYTYYEWRKEKPNQQNNISIMEPSIGKCTYTIGRRVTGRPKGFVIAEFGSVKRAKSNFGQFLSITWHAIYDINEVFGNIMDKYFKYEYPLNLESTVCTHLPEKDLEREVIARQFLWVRRDNNPELYTTGQLNQPLEVVPMTLNEFDYLFEMGKTDGPSQEVPVLVCGYVNGVKYGKEIQLTDVNNNRKFSEKPYSLAFKPVLFLILEP